MQVSQVFLYVCCKCFILMFAYVYNGYTRVFKSFCVLQVFHVCCKCFSYLGRMLQVFHLNVAKIDRVLYMLQCACEGERACVIPMLVSFGRCGPHVGTQNAGSGKGVCRCKKWRS
jgi:hypothetical protein